MSLSRAIGKPVVATPERQVEAGEDLRVIQQVKAGDVAAFDRLILKYRERVYSVIYNLTANREDAADLSQDVFIRAFQSINRFQNQSSFFTWLYRITVNTALTHLRKNRLRSFFSLEKIVEEDSEALILGQFAVQAGAEKEAYMRELQEKLNESLQKLSIKHRTVITLFEIDNLSHAEIAEIMGCSVGTVRSRLHYAKQLLQADLKNYLS